MGVTTPCAAPPDMRRDARAGLATELGSLGVRLRAAQLPGELAVRQLLRLQLPRLRAQPFRRRPPPLAEPRAPGVVQKMASNAASLPSTIAGALGPAAGGRDDMMRTPQ